jgi:hypothetical protein
VKYLCDLPYKAIIIQSSYGPKEIPAYIAESVYDPVTGALYV